MTVHTFQKSLEYSNQYVDAPWWPEVYRKAFPGMAQMHSVRQDGWAQRGGVDRQIIMRDGKVLAVDEKVRDEDWPDILLERWSDRDRGTAGWVQKPLACDFIAYAFVPSRRCYLLPVPTLRRAWVDNGQRWIKLAERFMDGFAVVLAENQSHDGKGYVTESVAVPTDVLLDALKDALIVDWQAA